MYDFVKRCAIIQEQRGNLAYKKQITLRLNLKVICKSTWPSFRSKCLLELSVFQLEQNYFC